MSADNRQHIRFAVEVAAELTLGTRTLAAATQNVSEGGVGLVLDQPLAQGTAVQLALFLTQDGIEDPDEEPFEVRATVAWSGPQEGGLHVAGVRFGAVTAAQRAQLARFLAALGP